MGSEKQKFGSRLFLPDPLTFQVGRTGPGRRLLCRRSYTSRIGTASVRVQAALALTDPGQCGTAPPTEQLGQGCGWGLASALLARLLGPVALGPRCVSIGEPLVPWYRTCAPTRLAEDPDRRPTLRQADQVRKDFVTISTELDCGSRLAPNMTQVSS